MSAFNSDTFIKGELEKLVKKFGVKTIVETGTYKGHTTVEFAKLVSKVFTIEINDHYYQMAQKEFVGKNNIVSIRGSSPTAMLNIIKGHHGDFEKPSLFYLDAHWYKYNPLLDELKILATQKMKQCLIAIHDFKVPNKDFGFDKFSNGTAYTYEFIQKSVENIYGVGKFEYHYNEQADGAKRGIIFIYPKQ